MATSQVRRLLLLLGLTLLIFTGISIYYDLRDIGDKYRNLAREMGRSLFKAINTMRAWNLDHDGIYIRESADIQPNPYLAESLRSLRTEGGKSLAMINHAEMVRLFSELLSHDQAIHLHLSGLNPLRPDNRSDAWEQKAILSFEAGGAEAFDVVNENGDATFRYMEPLRLEKRCLSCHPDERDSPGLVRGGISVSFPYAPFQKAAAAERRQNIFVHCMFLCLAIGVLVFLGRKMLVGIEALQQALLHVKRLEGLLPICANCKKIRLGSSDHREQKSWIEIETYLRDRTDAEFTHGLCPECATELYPEYFPENR